MNDKIPFIAYESMQACLHRIIRRLCIVIVLLIVLLVATNLGWLYYESQFEETVTTEQTVEQDAEDGGNIFVGGDINE